MDKIIVTQKVRGGIIMSSTKSLMSESLEVEISKQLGVYDKVKSEGWGSVSSKDCGNMIKKAIEIAERKV